MHRRATALLMALITVMGIIGSIASVSAGWGWPGLFISVGLLTFMLILCYFTLGPIFYKNDRGVTLITAIESVGLVDIENREDLLSSLPPHRFYERAHSEIVISGISAFRTFDQHLELLKNCLSQGKHVFVLLLHPNASILNQISPIEEKDIANEIRTVIQIASDAGLSDHPGFKLRFRETLPPFTGVMIDGDLEKCGAYPRDNDGEIRVQPVSPHRSQHKGIVLQLRKRKGKVPGTFRYFADDLRQQWVNDARSDETLF